MKLLKILNQFGFSPQKCLFSLVGLPRYLSSLVQYQRISRHCSAAIPLASLTPVFSEFKKKAGTARGHYFWQDLWAAQKIYECQPVEHIDVGSRVDGFIAHLLVFRKVKLIDIRPLECVTPRLSFMQENATELKGLADDSIESISSLHAVEHFGLGRYGDPIDPVADYKVMKALARVLKPGGRLYFSVPVGKECVYFNAHRVYSPSTIIKRFKSLVLLSFSVIDDEGDFFENASLADWAAARYACGLFEFTKDYKI